VGQCAHWASPCHHGAARAEGVAAWGDRAAEGWEVCSPPTTGEHEWSAWGYGPGLRGCQWDDLGAAAACSTTSPGSYGGWSGRCSVHGGW
jgi:hypothetical protein